LAGKAPFTGTPEAVMYGIMTKDPAPLGQFLAPDVAAFYETVLARAMAKNPAQRFATAAAFSEALRARNAAPQASGDETVIVSRVVREAAHEPASHHAFGFGRGALTPPTSVTNWEDATLARVQAALARYMGPMAKVQVRQASRKCTSLPDLVALLAQDIPDPQHRAKFVEQLQVQYAVTSLGTSSLTGSVGSGASRSAGAPVSPAVPAALVDLATSVMTRQMGPIAKIVVKKIAARAQSQQQFLALLAQELPQGPKRDQLISELSQAALAPK
jgi:serine/threonine-protein kinase